MCVCVSCISVHVFVCVSLYMCMCVRVLPHMKSVFLSECVHYCVCASGESACKMQVCVGSKCVCVCVRSCAHESVCI